MDQRELAAALESCPDPERLALLFLPSHQARSLCAQLRSDERFRKTRVYLVPSDPNQDATELPEDELDTEHTLSSDALTHAEWSELLRDGLRAFLSLGNDPCHTRYYLDTKYNLIFDWFEQTRWDWSALPNIEALDRSALPANFLSMVKQAAIAEFGTLPAAHNFLREWYDEVSFSSWSLAWAAEESRHSLVLCRYLRAAGDDMLTKHALYKRTPYEQGEAHASTLMMNIISETRASETYLRLAAVSPEPIIAAIFKLLSRDEARHASAFAQFCNQLCEVDDRHKVSALEQAYFWLANQVSGGFKHPAGEFYKHTQTAQSFSQAEAVLGRESVDAADAVVLRVIRKLVRDQSIRSARDVKRWLREH